jgi:exodeoxyribonuclease VII large subunit
LKDENSVISAVFFKYANKSLNFKLEEGMSILAFGGINVFEKRGSIQFIIAMVRLEGVGEILKRIEQLKKKLFEEGVFDPSHKKRLPVLPRRLGIVTSPTGAAVRDIIKVATRRFPNIEIIIAPAKVQGDDAAQSIVTGIEALNDPALGIDVIIAGRGGGSFEDLLPFNEEIVVRAFYNSKVPIISAVGHQIDHPLCDDAADVSAPTPSAAAETAVPEKGELQEYIDILNSKAYNALKYRVREAQAKIESIRGLRVFRDPMEIAYNKELVLSEAGNRLFFSMKEIVSENRNRLMLIPDVRIIMKNIFDRLKHKLEIAYQAVEMLSPKGVLERGYAIAADAKGGIIKGIGQLKVGDGINLILYNGSAGCSVDSIKKEVYFGREKKENG